MTVDWTDSACRGLPTEWFFAERGESTHPDAIAACKACPIQSECKDWALHHETIGYWAGMSAEERRLARKELGISIETPMATSEVWTDGWYREYLESRKETA